MCTLQDYVLQIYILRGGGPRPQQWRTSMGVYLPEVNFCGT